MLCLPRSITLIYNRHTPLTSPHIASVTSPCHATLLALLLPSSRHEPSLCPRPLPPAVRHRSSAPLRLQAQPFKRVQTRHCRDADAREKAKDRSGGGREEQHRHHPASPASTSASTRPAIPSTTRQADTSRSPRSLVPASHAGRLPIRLLFAHLVSSCCLPYVPRLQQLLSTVRVALHPNWNELSELDELLWKDEEKANAVVGAGMDMHSLSFFVISFPLVQQMALCIEQPTVDVPEGVMSALFDAQSGTSTAAPAHYTRLHSLHIVGINYETGEAGDEPRLLLPPFFAPLRSLPSLRTLHLSIQPYGDECGGCISWDAFCLLVSLPLTCLDLSFNHVYIPADMRATVEVLADWAVDVTSTGRVLRLPRFELKAATRAAMLKRLLCQYTHHGGDERDAALDCMDEERDKRGILEHVTLHQLDTAEVGPAEHAAIDRAQIGGGAHRRLTAKSCPISCALAIDRPRYFHVLLVAAAALLPPVCPSSASASPHIHSQSLPPLGGGHPVIQRYIDLVSSHSATFRCLELDDILVFDSCRPILQAVFACAELRRCTLGTSSISCYEKPAAQLPRLSLPPLLQLHTLQFNLPFTHDELGIVLSACPAVQDLRAVGPSCGHTLCPLQQLQLVGAKYQKVRKFSIVSCCPMTEEAAGDLSAASSVTAAPPSSSTASSSSSSDSDAGPLLSQLVCLTLYSHVVHNKPAWSEAGLLKLVHTLRAAPLHFLSIESAPLYHLHHLSVLSRLRSLQLPDVVLVDPSLSTDYSRQHLAVSLHRYFRDYGSDAYESWREQFGGWVAQAHQPVTADEAERAVTDRLISDEDVAPERLWEWEPNEDGQPARRVLSYRLFESQRMFEGGKGWQPGIS